MEMLIAQHVFHLQDKTDCRLDKKYIDSSMAIVYIILISMDTRLS